ncbi:hypothetical protein TN53_22615 [Streptomyces sp. WM6386]|nr:hypothetical protein TN53_22615 [Streptomyces sp. WM6386]
MSPLLRLRPPLTGGSHRGRRSRARVLDRIQDFFAADFLPIFFARSSSGSVPSSTYASHFGFRHGPATQTGTHAPSVL